ncbi:MAG TPA: DnaA/Hda family protein [bacterium]
MLSERLPADEAAAWLPHLHVIALEPRRVVLGGLPNAFFKSRVEKQFRAVMLDCLRTAFPDVIAADHPRLECRVNGAAVTAPDPNQLPLPLAPPASATEEVMLPRPPAVTFEDVVEGESNRMALQFARDVVAQPGKRFNPLFLVGPTGSGKTHLVQAIAGALVTTQPGMNVVRVSGEAFKIEVLEAIQARKMKPVRDKYQTADALIVDDLQFLLVTPKAQEELLHTFDKLHSSGRQVIVTADRLPQAMTGLNETLRSRLEMGLVTELGLPDAAVRLRLVLARARHDGVALPDPVAKFLADQITNPRQLVGALVRLAAYGALLRQPITLEFAREYAAPFLEVAPLTAPIAISPDALVAKVCERMGIAVRALKSPDKSTALVRARQIVTLLLKDLAGLSYSEISRWVGNRATSTLSHAYQSAQKQLEASPHLRRMVTQLRHDLTHGAKVTTPQQGAAGRTGEISNGLSNRIR